MANEAKKKMRTLEFGIVPGGFGIAASVWLTAFVCRIPTIAVDGHLLLGLLLALMLGGAILAGRFGRPICFFEGSETLGEVIRRTTLTMLVAGLVNVLLVGSVVGAASVGAMGDGAPANRVTLSAVWWAPGSLIATALIGALAGLLVGTIRGKDVRDSEARATASRGGGRPGQQAALGFVIVFTTMCLILVGGVVTSAEAGLSVPDWPNSYGWNMFLFPFSKMVGGIYYEHAHRLIGSLVGLETLVLFVWLWLRPPMRRTVERRRSEWAEGEGCEIPNRKYSWVGTAAFVLVCVQGFLGGARVFLVDEFGHSATEKIAVVHAAHAQVFLLVIGMLAWYLRRQSAGSGVPGKLKEGGGLVVLGWMSVGLLVLVLAQTVAGAMYRHLGGVGVLGIHVAGASFVFVLIMLEMGIAFTGSLGSDPRSMRVLRSIFVTFVIVGVQLALGFGSWWVTSRYDRIDQVSSGGMVFLTAGHVVCGSVLLVFSGWSALWVLNFRRLGAFRAD